MTPTPREVDAVYRVLARTYPRAAPFWILAKAAHPLPQRTTRAALRILRAAGLAYSPRRGQYAAARARGLRGTPCHLFRGGRPRREPS
jgi:hypothetical protein